MLSLSFSTTTFTTSTTTNTTSLNNPFLPKTPNLSTSKTQNPKLTPKPIITSNQLSTNLEEPYPNNILLNRRNALLSLVSLSTTLPYTPAMAAAPSPPTFPRPLDSVTRARVLRPAKLRSKEDKEKEEEVLVVKIEQLREDEVVKFDVYINVDEEDFEEEFKAKTGASSAEYAGSYVALPRPPKPGREKLKTVLKLGLTSLIDDIGADGDDFVDVVLVPRAGSDALLIRDVNIEFLA